MTEESTLVEQAALGNKDQKVVAAVARARDRNTDGATHWHVGVRNEQGLVYRVVHLRGVKQAVDFAKELERMGFIDEIPSDGRGIEGYDTTFRLALS